MAEDGKLQVPIPLEVIADQGAGMRIKENKFI